MLNHAMSVQSDFSIGKSLLTVDKIVEAAKGLGYSSVAIVDDMSLHALVDFSNKATKANIKPVFGCRLRVYDDSKYRKPPASSGIAEKRNLMFCPKVYVKSEKGIKGLFKLLTDANSKEQYYYHSRTDLDALCKLEDVVVTTGDMYGLFSHPDHERILKVLKARFGDDLYIEFSPINTPLFDRLNYLGYLAYEREKIKTVVTYPFNYLENEDADTLDVLSAIATNTQLDLHYRPIQYVKDFGFKEPKFILDHTKAAIQRMAKYERVNSAQAWKEGLKNISELVDKCQYIFEKQPVSLPKLSTDEFKTLCAKCLEGWKKRFSKEILGYKPTKAELDTVYKSRLGYELSILKKMGFESYFLLVEDLVMWSKNNGVIVGPGRGSCFLAGHEVVINTDGETKKIEDFEIGDKVIAHDGSIQEVVDVLSFDRDEEILHLTFDNGVEISCTKDHKFFSKTRGWIRADEINEEDEFDDVVELAKEIECKTNAVLR
ncbi:PHP domain-containing protein [Acinetobacter baumannii]|nr:PHP domain-containing protein [Acinetobacter baumannii]MEB6638967.1 PHP domain-containing protein [Acinetobacter baumannii]